VRRSTPEVRLYADFCVCHPFLPRTHHTPFLPRFAPGKSKMDKWVKKIQAEKTPRTIEVRVRERTGQERTLVLMLADLLSV